VKRETASMSNSLKPMNSNGVNPCKVTPRSIGGTESTPNPLRQVQSRTGNYRLAFRSIVVTWTVLFLVAFSGLVQSASFSNPDLKANALVIGIEGAYKPWGYTTSDGSLTGLEIDLFRDLCQRMHVRCTFKSQNWSGLIPSLLSGKFDMIVGLSINDTRRNVIEFSIPYAVDPSGFVTTKDAKLKVLDELGDPSVRIDLDNAPEVAAKSIRSMRRVLDGYTIGAQVGTSNMAFLRQHFRNLVKIREYDTIEQHNLDLTTGRIDAVFAHQQATHSIMLSSGDCSKLELTGPAFVGGVFGIGIGVGLRKGDTELERALNAAISSAQTDGTLTRLFLKWFGVDLSPVSKPDEENP